MLSEKQQRLAEVATLANAVEKYLAAYLGQFGEERNSLTGVLVRANNLAYALRCRQAQLAVEQQTEVGDLLRQPKITVIRPLSS